MVWNKFCLYVVLYVRGGVVRMLGGEDRWVVYFMFGRFCVNSVMFLDIIGFWLLVLSEKLMFFVGNDIMLKSYD